MVITVQRCKGIAGRLTLSIYDWLEEEAVFTRKIAGT
jgi:hypothetical protein